MQTNALLVFRILALELFMALILFYYQIFFGYNKSKFLAKCLYHFVFTDFSCTADCEYFSPSIACAWLAKLHIYNQT